MKMPTLRTTAGNQSCCSDCRRAFSECSRWLAESGLTRVLIYRLAEVFHSAATSRTFLRTPNPLFTRFTRRPCLCVSKNQSGSLSRFPKAAPLVVERGFQGGENRNSPLWRIFASFLCASRREGPAPARGARPAQAKIPRGGTR